MANLGRIHRVVLRPSQQYSRTFHSSVTRLRTPPVPLPPHSPSSSDPTSGSEGPQSSNQDAHSKKERSRHADWYATTVPAMIPVALVATA
ncbi:hypothetical protein FRC02_006136, partial [Tulasnella sp. 418]